MPWSPPVPFQPGVNVQRTPILNGAGWSYSNLIRFRDGLPEKNGGWARISDQQLIGTMRGMNVWADLAGMPYCAAGSEQRLEVLSLGEITDITPVVSTTNPVPNFSTVINTPTVTIVDAGAPATLAVGDWININIYVSIGGLILTGLYQVATVVSPTSYTITAPTNATATVNNAGTVPAYTTTNLSATVKVTLANHGLTTDSFYVNHIAMTIATVVIGAYSIWGISNVIDANNFQFIALTPANANAGPTSENGGNVRIQYLIPTGYATATLLAGFGVGLFGAGYFGTGGSGITYSTIRQWFMDHWGANLVCNYPASPIFQWVPPVALGNRALAINTTNYPAADDPPQKVNVSFVSMPQQIMMALGCEPSSGGTQDPNLIRWSDVSDNTIWVATATNQAGSFRIPTGSRLVGGISGPSFGLVWTDEDMYIFNYLGFPLVFGFNRVSGSVGLLAGRCVANVNGVVFWASSNGLYKFDGSSVSIVPCTVWDIIWRNLNRTQVDKCFLATNSWFNELTLFFPSASGTGEVDSYIRYNYREGFWDYGPIGTLYAFTTSHDESVLGPPISVDLNRRFQQHEIAADADGAQMLEYIQSGFFSIDNGWLLTMLDKVSADFKWEGTNPNLQFQIVTLDPITGATSTSSAFTSIPGDLQNQLVNMTGRLVALRVGFSSVGAWWRMGNFRYLFEPDGSL